MSDTPKPPAVHPPNKGPVTAVVKLDSLVDLFSSGGFTPLSVWQIIQKVLPDAGETIQEQLVGAFMRRLSGQIARSAAKMLARALTKMVDMTVDAPEIRNVTLDQKQEIAEALARNSAYQLMAFADALYAYPAKQREVANAKATGNPQALAEARRIRDKAADHVELCLVNVGRIAAGDRPRSEDPDETD